MSKEKTVEERWESALHYNGKIFQEGEYHRLLEALEKTKRDSTPGRYETASLEAIYFWEEGYLNGDTGEDYYLPGERGTSNLTEEEQEAYIEDKECLYIPTEYERQAFLLKEGECIAIGTYSTGQLYGVSVALCRECLDSFFPDTSLEAFPKMCGDCKRKRGGS